MKNGTKVVIATDKRGVFYGALVKDYSDGSVELRNARMCVYWSKETRGFQGLAAIGPQAGSRVSPAAPSATYEGVTCMLEASPKAVKAWESEPWG